MNLLINACHEYVNHPIRSTPMGHYTEQYLLGIAAIPLVAYIHESGHAIAARILYKNADPIISLNSFGFKGGCCYFRSRILSETGIRLGNNRSRALVAAMGPIAQMIVGLALLRFFPANGVSPVALTLNAAYAVSTLFEKSFYSDDTNYTGNDFIVIKVFQGRYTASAFIIACVVTDIFALYSLWNSYA